MSPIRGLAGLGLRAPHAAQLLEGGHGVGWFEVHSENYFGGGALNAFFKDFLVGLRQFGGALLDALLKMFIGFDEALAPRVQFQQPRTGLVLTAPAAQRRLAHPRDRDRDPRPLLPLLGSHAAARRRGGRSYLRDPPRVDGTAAADRC